MSEHVSTLMSATTTSFGQLLAGGTLGQLESSVYDISTPYDFCTKPYERLEGFWMLGSDIAIMLLALALYWIEPWRKIRREGLHALTEEDAPEVMQALRDLCREAGLKHMPLFVWAPLNPASSGCAFGRWGRYYVALTGGLVAEFESNPGNFRAVLRHELAHLRNADVDKAYYASAAWHAFIILALIPLLIDLALGLTSNPAHNLEFASNTVLSAAVLTGMVLLFRNSVLRAREFYADVRASVWDGTDGSLRRVVGALPGVPRAFWRRWLSVHPDPQARLKTIEDPGHLMQIDRWSFFGAGLAATIGYDGTARFLGYVLPEGARFRSHVFAVPIFALMLSALLGLMVWRHLFAGRTRPSQAPRVGILSLALTLGMVFGQYFSFQTALNQGIAKAVGINAFTGIGAFLLYATVYVFWFLLFWGFVHLILHWIVGASSAWLESMASPARLWILVAPSLIIFGLVLGYFMSAFLQFQELSSSMGWVLASIMLAGFFLDGFRPNVPLLIPFALAIFPLLAYFWMKKGPAVIPGWAFLDPVETPTPFPGHTALHPGTALVAGLLSGAAYIALILLVRVMLFVTLTESTRSTDLYKLALMIGLVALAGVIQAITGLIVFRRTGRLRTEHGLFAALIGGVVMTIGFLVANLIFGGTADLEFIILTLDVVVKLGFGLTLLAILSSLAFARTRSALRGRSAIKLAHAPTG